jgi:hypothetical protein
LNRSVGSAAPRARSPLRWAAAGCSSLPLPGPWPGAGPSAERRGSAIRRPGGPLRGSPGRTRSRTRTSPRRRPRCVRRAAGRSGSALPERRPCAPAGRTPSPTGGDRPGEAVDAVHRGERNPGLVPPPFGDRTAGARQRGRTGIDAHACRSSAGSDMHVRSRPVSHPSAATCADPPTLDRSGAALKVVGTAGDPVRGPYGCPAAGCLRISSPARIAAPASPCGRR